MNLIIHSELLNNDKCSVSTDRWEKQQVNFVLLIRRDFITTKSTIVLVSTDIHEVLRLSHTSIEVMRVIVLQIDRAIGDRPKHVIFISSVISSLLGFFAVPAASLAGAAVWETTLRETALWETALLIVYRRKTARTL